MTMEAVERRPRPKCELIPDCPGHCGVCLKPKPECHGHDPSRYTRFSIPTEPIPCPDQPRPQPKLTQNQPDTEYNVL